ncbi:hypothetical protein Y032_0017g3242 [Ancylostoma ceylanicum]|nr:hypothetical protein Y032_0017g3242 [Ancylostoma ceylanicum]
MVSFSIFRVSMATSSVDPGEREVYRCAKTHLAQRLCAPYRHVYEPFLRWNLPYSYDFQNCPQIEAGKDYIVCKYSCLSVANAEVASQTSAANPSISRLPQIFTASSFTFFTETLKSAFRSAAEVEATRVGLRPTEAHAVLGLSLPVLGCVQSTPAKDNASGH